MSGQTHELTIRVPIYIEPGRDYSYEPLREVLRAVIPLLRITTDGVICGDLRLDVADARDPLRTHEPSCLSLLPDFDRRDCTCTRAEATP